MQGCTESGTVGSFYDWKIETNMRAITNVWFIVRVVDASAFPFQPPGELPVSSINDF